ncbi:MAG: hypothetical protein L3J62_00005 [Gammaproteobacteria bacterium]|nr:hypothetical protein [Gammaproteobacteria bacterium]
MKKEYFLITEFNEYQLTIDKSTGIEQVLLENTPIAGAGKNIGGEIFYIINIDVSFNGKEQKIFNIGDIVYWRSQKEKKFAIAIFYGNTKFGNGDAPTAASPCIKFASINGDCIDLESVTSGSELKIICREIA